MREDHKLQAAVSEGLDMNPAINSSHVGVAVRDGIVTLTGHVPSLLERSHAEQVAGTVKGVKAVVNQMTVELPGMSLHQPEDPADHAADRDDRIGDERQDSDDVSQLHRPHSARTVYRWSSRMPEPARVHNTRLLARECGRARDPPA